MAWTPTPAMALMDWMPETDKFMSAVKVARDAAEQYGAVSHYAGIRDALYWCGSARKGAPVSGEKDIPHGDGRAKIRAECWLACTVAAKMPAPTRLDYERIGLLIPVRYARTFERSYSYGVWVALDWILGRRDSPGVPLDRGYVVPPPGGEAGLQAERDRQHAEAREHWRKTRAIADAQTAQR